MKKNKSASVSNKPSKTLATNKAIEYAVHVETVNPHTFGVVNINKSAFDSLCQAQRR